jgi:predicted transposase YdaD
LVFTPWYDILKEFLEQNATEVINMLITEWNTEDAKVVWREEAQEEKAMEIAQKALVEGLSIEVIHTITGLDIETIKQLASNPA